MPLNAGPKLPCHRFAIGGEASISDPWNLNGENKGEIAFCVRAASEFREQPRVLTVLSADAKMRIEQAGACHIEASAGDLRRVWWAYNLRGSRRWPRAKSENLRGHGRGHMKADHATNKSAAIEITVLNFVDHALQLGRYGGGGYKLSSRRLRDI